NAGLTAVYTAFPPLMDKKGPSDCLSKVQGQVVCGGTNFTVALLSFETSLPLRPGYHQPATN
ncbi:hypothetical protein RSW36_27510, partial [Escherichia coli]|uniref:hypothetical protein n=1 Tax=Escherichia coli TaxID=562 RepID=UPI0028DF48CF